MLTSRPLPSDEANELTWTLFRQHQVISRGQALRHLTEKAVRARLASGRWRPAAHGVFLAHTGPVTREQLRWVAVLAASARRPGVLAGLSALESYRFRGPRSDVIHVLIPDRSRDRNPPPGVVVHRTSHLPAADVHRAGQPPRTMPARSLVDAAQWAGSDDQARAVIAAGFQQRLVDFDEVAAVLDRMPRARRRAVAREAAANASAGSHSLPEREFLRLCRRAGLPVPSRQTRRRDGRGQVRYLDAYFAPWRLPSRSTAASTWRYGSGGRTCAARTSCGFRATGCSGSPRGRSDIARTR